ncbi:RcnB family protein [Undibacterium terreum]|uniref:Regulator RcnB of Ni and Co efflux n=1 Tax=Undibacterium terreum TaxID=1224302 RepID=A0A916UYF3_9BURK|nr:RcnB family protein [Undibacterium terreum]GGC94601.1 hypothetical protein GCM10011396_47450 [Undibacterium terreum]
MNYKVIVSAIMAMSIGLGNVAYAQNDDHRDDRGRGNQGNDRRGDDRRDHRDDHRDDRGNRYDQGRVYAEGSHNDRYENQRHRFQKGERLPPEYRAKQYVVDDWRGHHLNAPPRGYHWVQSGGDYVLAAVATGLILQVLLNN